MAILNKIREKTVVLILVIALALFAFILSGLLDNKDVLFSKSPNTVVTVNGKDISREQFMAQVEARQNPNATQSQIMNQVFDAMVRKAVMEAQYDKLGLKVGREQMRDLLKQRYANSPQFLNADGVFDESLMNQYIADLKKSSPQFYQRWIEGEKEIAANALQQNYINMIKGATTATVAEGELEYKLENDKVDIQFVQIPFTSIPDSTVSVSKSEIKDYMTKNSSKYEVEASRNFQYVKFEEVASKKDEDEIKDALITLIKGRELYNETTKETEKAPGFAAVSIENAEDFVNENSDAAVKYQDRFLFVNNLSPNLKDSITSLKVGAVYGPYKDGQSLKVTKLLAVKKAYDSLKVRHILIPFKDSLNPAPGVVKTELQAKKTADSILAIVKKDKSKFSELVQTMSSDQGSLANDGVYDWHPEGTMVEEFNAFEITKNVGDLGVVKTQFGFHIMELLDRKSPKEAYKLATIERKIEPSIETEDAIFREASNFEVLVGDKDFQEAAKAQNLKVNPVNTVKVLDENIPGAGPQRGLVRWMFEDGTEVGDVKRFKTTDGYIVAQLTKKNEAGLMNVEDASVTALPEIRKEKKAKLIKDRVSATNITDLAAAEKQPIKSALAINMKNPTVAGAGLEPVVVGTAFGLKEGKTSRLITGNKGVYMVKLIKKTPATKLDNYQSFANQVSTQKATEINTRLYNALKESAQIEDNRANTVQ